MFQSIIGAIAYGKNGGNDGGNKNKKMKYNNRKRLLRWCREAVVVVPAAICLLCVSFHVILAFAFSFLEREVENRKHKKEARLS